jgi:hypothetical protein
MTVLETIKANPQGVTKGLIAFACAGVVLYFTLAGKPEQAQNITNEIGAMVVPISTAIGIASALISAMHFSRGPVPVVAAPVVVETVTQAKAEGIMPVKSPTVESPK